MNQKNAELQTVTQRTGVRRVAIAYYAFYAVAIALALFADLALRPIWLDEAFSYYQVRDRDLAGLFRSFEGGINALPPSYFLILWAIDQLVGLGAVGLRLPSAIFGIAGVLLLHRLLRPHFGDALTFASIAAALLLSHDFMRYTYEGRPYSLYFLVAVLSLYAALSLVKRERPQARNLAVNGLVAFALPSVHYVGLLYSAATCLVLLVMLRRHGWPVGWRIALTYMAGWAAFAVIHFSQILLFLRNQGVVRADWIKPSHTWEVFDVAKEATQLLPAPLQLVLFVFAVLLVVTAYRENAPTTLIRTPLPIGENLQFLIGTSLLWAGMPVVLHATSLLGLPTATLPRYFVPTFIAVAVFAAFTLHVFAPRRTTDTGSVAAPGEIAALLICAFFLSYGVLSDVRNVIRAPHLVAREILDSDFAEIVQSDAPTITNNIHMYFPYVYHRSEDRLTLLRETPREVEAMKKFDPALKAATPQDLARLDRFLYLWRRDDSVNAFPAFKVDRWAQANGYTVSLIAERDGRVRLFEVVRSAGNRP